jgi:hypothetical protein
VHRSASDEMTFCYTVGAHQTEKGTHSSDDVHKSAEAVSLGPFFYCAGSLNFQDSRRLFIAGSHFFSNYNPS